MSAVDGVQRTLFVAGTLLQKGYHKSEVLSTSDSYTCSSLPDASTIEMGATLPAGAKVQLIVLKHPAFATARTLSVGDNASATRYATTQAVATAGTISIPCGNYVVGTASGDDQLLLTTAGIFNSATPIQMTCFYTM